jgi:hypothetical protein
LYNNPLEMGAKENGNSAVGIEGGFVNLEGKKALSLSAGDDFLTVFGKRPLVDRPAKSHP